MELCLRPETHAEMPHSGGQTVLKLPCWVRDAHPSTVERAFPSVCVNFRAPSMGECAADPVAPLAARTYSHPKKANPGSWTLCYAVL